MLYSNPKSLCPNEELVTEITLNSILAPDRGNVGGAYQMAECDHAQTKKQAMEQRCQEVKETSEERVKWVVDIPSMHAKWMRSNGPFALSSVIYPRIKSRGFHCRSNFILHARYSLTHR